MPDRKNLEAIVRQFSMLSHAQKKGLLRVVAGMNDRDASVAIERVSRIPPKALAAHLHARTANAASLTDLLTGNHVERKAAAIDIPTDGPRWKTMSRRPHNIDGVGRQFVELNAPLRAWNDDDQQYADNQQQADNGDANDAQQADNDGANGGQAHNQDDTVRDDAYGATAHRTLDQDDNHLYDQDAFINDADKNAMIDRAMNMAEGVLAVAAVVGLAALFAAVLHPAPFGKPERRALNDLARRAGDRPRKGATVAELSQFRSALLSESRKPRGPK